METCHEEDKINLLCFVYLPGYTLDAGLKKTKTEIKKIQEVVLFSIFENAIRGRITGCVESRYVVSVVEKRIFELDSNDSNCLGMAQFLPNEKIKNDHTVNFEKFSFTLDKSDNGYVLEVAKKHKDKA